MTTITRRRLGPSVHQTRAPMLSPRDVAESIGVARETVYRALETGDLRGHKIGTGPKAPWRIRVEDVEAWCS